MQSIVLASASPRRAELLRQIGLSFLVQPADIDETPASNESAEHYVERLAREKALAGSASKPGCLVIGSDTSVVLEGRILGKPDSTGDATVMLQALSGTTHQVMTGVAVVHKGICESRLVIANVRFRELLAAEIAAYVATGEPMDKAGGYGIQGAFAMHIKDILGSYTNIVGLCVYNTRIGIKKPVIDRIP